MNQVSFDTHAAMQRLGQAGASTPLAEAVVDIVTEATSLNLQMVEDLAYVKSLIETNMATKADIAALRGDSATLRADAKADIAALRADAKADIAALRGDSAALRAETKADIASLRADLFRALWIQGGVLAGLILALAGVMLGFAGVVLTGS